MVIPVWLEDGSIYEIIVRLHDTNSELVEMHLPINVSNERVLVMPRRLLTEIVNAKDTKK